MQTEAELLREQLNKIAASGALGRSRSYARLLEFLVACAAEGRAPKELEIAMEVFAKGADFDPSQDSMVRVYAYNLRQKLEHHYATDGRGEPQQLSLARGEYRVSMTPAAAIAAVAAPVAPVVAPSVAAVLPPADLATPATVPAAAAVPDVAPSPPIAAAGPSRWRFAWAGGALLVAGVVLGVVIAAARAPAPRPMAAVAASPIWHELLNDDLPILVVVGDYYIFGELDEHGEVTRLVRDFGVGSRKQLDELMVADAALAVRYLDLDLTYLPTGAAASLLDVLHVLYTADKPVRIVPMSEMSDTDLKSSHIVYVGYISAFDKLEEFVFASSSLAIGYTYDELRNTETGEFYSSEAGMPEVNRNYRDYAFISTFPGPGGNQFLVIAGTRDAGMMQGAHVLSDPMFVRSLEQSRPDTAGNQPPAFEMLYEVTGYGRTNLDALLVHSAKLSYQEIWGGNFLQQAGN
jgi:hypothetical protein